MKINKLTLFLTASLLALGAHAQDTYAEKLGWPKGAKVVIFHVDDPGMSYSSNQGTIKSVEQGVATSCSIMFPCPWSASFVNYIKKSNPNLDAGVHLTLTSEWRDYRWTPLAGFQNVPSLVDNEGNLWHEVAQVVKNGTADDVEKEIRAQVERALRMGLKPTHLDSHMGTLQLRPEFFDIYLDLAVDFGLPLRLSGASTERAVGFPFRRLAAEEGVVFPDHFLHVQGLGSRGAIAAVLADLRPGVTEIYLHPAVDTPELRAIAPDWVDRVDDHDYLTDRNGLAADVAAAGASLIGYRELRPLQQAG